MDAAGGSPDRVTVVNETDLPDAMVTAAVRDHFIENASMAWGHTTTFQNYTGNGSMLARREYRTPTNVIDEIRLARDLAERDDDVAAALGSQIATAFESGMENFHEDEKTVGLFNAICREANFDSVLKEMYREYLIASSVTTISLFTRQNLEWRASDGVTREESLAVPVVGILQAENIRVIGDDTFGTGTLAFDPPDDKLRNWLETYFNPRTTPAKKAEMGRTNRVAAAIFTGVVGNDDMADTELAPYNSGSLYLLNPKLVHRTTMPKGAWNYPRPLLTRNFALLEAKRLLNILDFSLLQGGSNFIVVVKKGSDQRPAQPGEMANLQNVVRAASKTGVIVGDHRLSIEVITPDLKELLNPAKRRLIGRKLSMALLRVPESGVEDPGTEGMKTEIELMGRVISGDRQDIKRHIERFTYKETVRRNKRVFPKGAPKLWFPKIVLQGSQYFTDYVIKLRDRGDIPRKWAVEAGGFDYEAGVQQRQRELDAGDDEVLTPGSVPHSSPESGPQDNNPGRPPGGQDDNPNRRTLEQNPGETIRSFYDEVEQAVLRVGVVTETILEEYADHTVGRIQQFERDAIESGEPLRRGSLMGVPVNQNVAVRNEKALKLREGLRMVVGQHKTDGALLAKLLVFREPEFSISDAETTVARWGFPMTDLQGEVAHDENGLVPAAAPDPKEEVAATPAPMNLHVEVQQGRVKRIVRRDPETGEIIGSEEVPVEDEE